MLPTTFQSIWPSCFRGEDFQKSINQKQELPVVAMFVNGSGQKELSLQRTFHRRFLPSFGSFGKSVSEDKIFRNRPIRNKNCLWQPYLLMDQNEMSNFIEVTSHNCILPSFGSFGKAVSEDKIFQKSTSQKQELPVATMFVNGSELNQQYLQRIFHRLFLPSFDSFGQAVSENFFFRN